MRKNVAGARIRVLRKELSGKVSQRAFAELLQLAGLDLTKNAIQRMESGQRSISDIELRMIAVFFGVTADDLLS